TSGPDDALWFTERERIGRITTDGTVSEYEVGALSRPSGIAVGVDRAIWFTKAFSFPPGNRISRFGADGSLADFPIPTAIAQPSEIVLGIDRSLWFTEYGGNQIGRIGQDGTITEFPIPTRGSEPIGITVGPDGNLWFVENGGRVYIEGAVPEPQPNNIA